MTAQNYAQALKRVLAHEGGYANHPEDPGGATMKGVTQAVYDAYRKRRGLSTRSVRLIEEPELQAIYRQQYWDAIQGDKLPAGIDYVVFDGAVNSGPLQSVKWLQRALGNVVVDGMIGDATLAAVEAYPNLAKLIDAICDRRLAFLKALKTWGTFGKGWSSRVTGVRSAGKAMVQGRSPGAPVATTAPRGTISQAASLPARGAADAATGAGVGSGGIAAILDQARSQLDPLATASDLIGRIVAVLVVVSAVLTIGGLAWRWYAARKAKQQADALDLPQAVA